MYQNNIFILGKYSLYDKVFQPILSFKKGCVIYYYTCDAILMKLYADDSRLPSFFDWHWLTKHFRNVCITFKLPLGFYSPFHKFIVWILKKNTIFKYIWYLSTQLKK